MIPAGRIFLHKIEQVFLWFGRIAAASATVFSSSRFGRVRQSILTDFVDTLRDFSAGLSLLAARFLRAFVPVHAVVHQRVARVQSRSTSSTP